MTTDQLQRPACAGPAAVLEHDRRLYEQQIVRAADLIAAHAQERPAVLLAGPSGSGKTTTALLIERELDRRGMETHTLSMDDYFCPLTERELELSAATSWTSSARRASTCRFPGAARQAAGGRGGGAAAL